MAVGMAVERSGLYCRGGEGQQGGVCSILVINAAGQWTAAYYQIAPMNATNL